MLAKIKKYLHDLVTVNFSYKVISIFVALLLYSYMYDKQINGSQNETKQEKCK